MIARVTNPIAVWRVCALAVTFVLAPLARAQDVAPDVETSTVATLREANALREAGSYATAAETLAGLAGTELAADVGLLRTRLLLSDGKPEEAAQTAQAALALDPPAEVRANLYAELARASFDRGDLAAAAAAQANAWDATRDDDYAARLMLQLGQAWEQNQRPADAFSVYGRIWRGYPLAPSAVEAYARTRELGPTLGEPPADSSALVARADRLRERFRCDLSLPLYETVLARPETTIAEKVRLERARADCLFERRRYPEALEAYRAIGARNPSNMDVQILIGRSLARSGDRKAAIVAFEALAKSKDALTRARARSFLAIVVEDDDPPRALDLLRKVEKQNADPTLAAAARWSLAWADLRAGNDEAALTRLDLLSEGPISDIEIQRARYWRGVVRARSEKPLTKEAGEVQLRALVEDVPLSYYGALAAERVGAQPAERRILGPRLAEVDPAPLRRARWLVDGGFPEVAQDELVSFGDESRITREQRIALARLFYRTGDPHRAQQLIQNGFGSVLEEGVDPTWRDAWELAWPRAFRDDVAAAERELQFDPPLVYAVMREESEFRPEVGSPAGALGLMQIIPPTGDRIAAELGVIGFEPVKLYDPALNIRFGTWYLRSLTERFAGSRPLAIASYNAGPEAVTRWLGRDGALPADEFVDSVPYGETRRYLRRVLRSYQMYRLLYPAATAAAPTPAAEIAPAADPPPETPAQTPAEPDR